MQQRSVNQKPVVLFTTPVLHHPPVGGPALRIENSIKALSCISDLHLYSRVSPSESGGQEAASFYRQLCSSFYLAPSLLPRNRYAEFGERVVNFLSRRAFKRNLFDPQRGSKKDFQHLLRVADAVSADVIWLGYGNISYPLLSYVKHHSSYKVVLDTDSVWSRFISRGQPFAGSEHDRQRIWQETAEKEEEERLGTALADVTTAVSQVDAEYYRNLTQDPQRVHLFSNVIDTATYQAVGPMANGLQHPCMYLAGTFWPGSPMEDAARWTIESVFPLVRSHMPAMHFYIVGQGSDQVLADIRDPQITVTGRLLSVLPYLCHADVVIVPLRFESGTRFKILEAGACALPVISTTLGAEGIPVSDGESILIADTPELFARSILRVVTETKFAQKLAENLRNLVCRQYGLPSLIQEGQSILTYLSKPADDKCGRNGNHGFKHD
jgi:glycosyltransferase involved in cell wall biosynthesis